jgi:hypothetical protein
MADNQPDTSASVPEINIIDLENCVKIIDHAAEQGAFHGWDVIRQVMEVRDKLNKFVEVVKPQVEKQQEAEEPKSSIIAPKKKNNQKKVSAI